MRPGAPGPKRIMNGSTASRFAIETGRDLFDNPGPGHYDFEMPHGNLLKQTYNVAIAEQSADLHW